MHAKNRLIEIPRHILVDKIVWVCGLLLKSHETQSKKNLMPLVALLQNSCFPGKVLQNSSFFVFMNPIQFPYKSAKNKIIIAQNQYFRTNFVQHKRCGTYPFRAWDTLQRIWRHHSTAYIQGGAPSWASRSKCWSS